MAAMAETMAKVRILLGRLDGKERKITVFNGQSTAVATRLSWNAALLLGLPAD